MRYGEHWRDFNDTRRVQMHHQDTVTDFSVFGESDPIPDAEDDEIGVSLRIALDPAIRNSGPATLTLAGIAWGQDRMPRPPPQGSLAQSEAVRDVSSATLCNWMPREIDTEWHYTGTLELETNTDTEVKGRLVLTGLGSLNGSCGGDETSIDVPFSIAPLLN
ncbi:hypothetical protein A176_003517 [Myxococcus hansupus]|uniref:Uncharacterized protein n=1 Tax=Pseudomyxococcus hansupus TaxID=1297742 RepID=A0A0H4WZ27_9BACT|nr:hypothetical protein A176_003517 [Myxococcus hansupus]